jgi:hypothetical protein
MVWMNYIDTKLKLYPSNPYQRHQTKKRKCIFIKKYLNRNANSFYSRELLVQHNISIEDPLMVDMSEDLDKKSCS